MSIAQMEHTALGALLLPDGPFTIGAGAGFPAPEFRPGQCAFGDRGSRFTYVMFRATAGQVLTQGDVIAWDNSFQAYLITTALARRGESIGTVYFGGRTGDPGGLPSSSNWPFKYTFGAAGIYGMWVQTSGMSLINSNTTFVLAGLGETTTTAGRLNGPAVATAATKAIEGVNIVLNAPTFTGTTTIGSNILTSVSTLQGIEVGLGISGTGIPAGNFIESISGDTITMGNKLAGGSNLATAAGAVTITATRYVFTANTVSGSNQLTNISNLGAIYPGQIATAAGIPASTTILSIEGNPGGQTITLSANATATATSVTVTAQALVEGELHEPYVGATN